MEQEIIILHGWNSNLIRWKKLQHKLSKKFKVYLPNLPGFRKSKLIKPWDLGNYADWLKKYLIKKRIENPIIIGHSFGGSIAIKYLNKHSIKKLILINSAGIRNKISFKKIFGLLLAKAGKIVFNLPILNNFRFFSKKYLYKILNEKDYFLADENLKQTMINVINYDLTEELSKVKIPTLILWGGKDKITPLSHAYIFNKKILNSKLCIWKKQGHALPFEKYKEVYNKIKEFIDKK